MDNQTEILDEMFIEMEDENGKPIKCEVLAIFPVEGRQYMVVCPENIEENWIYRFTPVGEEDFNLEYIEEETEFQAAMDAFEKMVEEAEIDSVLE